MGYGRTFAVSNFFWTETSGHNLRQRKETSSNNPWALSLKICIELGVFKG